MFLVEADVQAIADAVREVLEQQHSRCLDDERDRVHVAEAVFECLRLRFGKSDGS